MDLPTQFTKPDFSALTKNGDAIPSSINRSTISFVGEFLSASLTFFVSNLHTTVAESQNTESVAFGTTVLKATGNQGWTTIETVLVRIDTSFTPSGRFPLYANLPDTQTRIGYDVAVCIQQYEPWMLEVHNASTGSPSALRIVEKGDGSASLLPSGNSRGSPIASTRYLNTTGKDSAFSLAHGNSYVRMNQVSFSQSETSFNYTPSSIVGPVVPPRTIFLLTSTYFTGHLFHRRSWASRIHRTLSRSVRRYPRTGRCAQRSALLCRVRIRCRTTL